MTLTTGWCWRSRYGQSGPAPCERSEALVAQRSDVQGQRDPRRTLTSETSLAWLGANPDVRDNREMPAASRGSSPWRFSRRIQRNLGATAPKNPTGGGHRCRRLSLATMCERQESGRLASSPARHPFLVTQGLVSGRQATPLRLAWALARKFSFKQTEPYTRAWEANGYAIAGISPASHINLSSLANAWNRRGTGGSSTWPSREVVRRARVTVVLPYPGAQSGGPENLSAQVRRERPTS